MKKILFLTFFIPFLSFSQSKFSITGSAGLFSINKESNLNLNASLNYIIKQNAFTTGIDVFGSKNKVNTQNVYSDFYFAYLEYGNPKWGLKNNNYYFSFILGPGIINQRFEDKSITEYSTLLATKFNINVGKYSTFGLKTGFMFNELETGAFANLFITYRF
ncbi:hypothetical protein [Flavobacterium sp.]|uniref:hypothetical protein n=1 Tax=Flavobacterium sp. TaxID=239 RepID=UPI0025F57FE5|nr:hypothetical protein [Flavobacterium sp.]